MLHKSFHRPPKPVWVIQTSLRQAAEDAKSDDYREDPDLSDDELGIKPLAYDDNGEDEESIEESDDLLFTHVQSKSVSVDTDASAVMDGVQYTQTVTKQGDMNTITKTLELGITVSINHFITEGNKHFEKQMNENNKQLQQQVTNNAQCSDQSLLFSM